MHSARLAGSEAGAHYASGLVGAGQRELVGAVAGVVVRRLDSDGAEGALELAGGRASAEVSAEVPGRLHEPTRGEDGALLEPLIL